jgi:hypothetical protein
MQVAECPRQAQGGHQGWDEETSRSSLRLGRHGKKIQCGGFRIEA